MAKWREFLTLFAVQFTQYLLFCLSIIVLSKGSYLGIILTDTAYGLNSYFIIRKISTEGDKSHLGLAGFTLGGTCGSLVAIWLTKKFSH